MTSSRHLVIAVSVLAASLVLSCVRDAPAPSDGEDRPAAIAADSATSAVNVTTGWEPAGDYWKAYRAVLVIASCDSSGVVKSTEQLYSYASPAETDSALRFVNGMRLEPESYAGRIREDGIGPKRPGGPRFIVPVPTPGEAVPPEDLPSRADLEHAGLGPWLALCDELLPGWPYEKWVVAGPVELYRRRPEQTVEDTELRAAGLVSPSPDGSMNIHPFYSVQFTEEGRPMWDVDSGFVLYESAPPHAARQYVDGTVYLFLSAEWIDKEHYIVAAIGEEGISLGGMWTGYRVPMLWIGHVDSMSVTALSGPPFPLPAHRTLYDRFRDLQIERYPELRRSL